MSFQPLQKDLSSSDVVWKPRLHLHVILAYGEVDGFHIGMSYFHGNLYCVARKLCCLE